MEARADISDEHRESQFNIVGLKNDTVEPSEDVQNDNYGVRSGYRSNRTKHGSSSHRSQRKKRWQNPLESKIKK